MSARKIVIPYDELYQAYVEQEKTISECADFFRCSSGVVLRNMKEHGIASRPRGLSPKRANSVDLHRSESEIEVQGELLEGAGKRKRYLERLVLLSAIKEASIQDLLEEALELLFGVYEGKMNGS